MYKLCLFHRALAKWLKLVLAGTQQAHAAHVAVPASCLLHSNKDTQSMRNELPVIKVCQRHAQQAYRLF
jgi:hypothetical protein